MAGRVNYEKTRNFNLNLSFLKKAAADFLYYIQRNLGASNALRYFAGLLFNNSSISNCIQQLCLAGIYVAKNRNN